MKRFAMALLPDMTHSVMIAVRLIGTVMAYVISRHAAEPLAHIAAFAAHVGGVMTTMMLVGHAEKTFARAVGSHLKRITGMGKMPAEPSKETA